MCASPFVSCPRGCADEDLCCVQPPGAGLSGGFENAPCAARPPDTALTARRAAPVPAPAAAELRARPGRRAHLNALAEVTEALRLAVHGPPAARRATTTPAQGQGTTAQRACCLEKAVARTSRCPKRRDTPRRIGCGVQLSGAVPMLMLMWILHVRVFGSVLPS